MSTVCCCSSRTCELFGCQRDAQDRARLAPFNTPVNHNPAPINPVVGRTYPLVQLTEADVRRIVREELARAQEAKP